MRTVLILSNHHLYTFNLRKELIQRLLDYQYRVIIALPYGEKVEAMKEMGCEFIDVPLNRRGTNPITDAKLFFSYNRILKKVKPDVVLTYTLKPNLYGGLACRINNVKVIHTVTGLGSVFVRNVWYKKLIILLNRLSFKPSNLIAFMNVDNQRLYQKLGIVSSHHKSIVVAGSGVNLEKFKYSPLSDSDTIDFIFIARVLKDKGIEEYLYAAKKLKKIYNNVNFIIVGFVDEEKYKTMLDEYQNQGVITYLGKQDDIPKVMRNSTCIVLPSYGEGRGTVLQEGAAIGRPLITCDTYGCRDNVEDSRNGFLCKVADAESLANVMEKFINTPKELKKLMGERSRKKAEEEFDRMKVVQIYFKEVNRIILSEG